METQRSASDLLKEIETVRRELTEPIENPDLEALAASIDPQDDVGLDRWRREADRDRFLGARRRGLAVKEAELLKEARDLVAERVAKLRELGRAVHARRLARGVERLLPVYGGDRELASSAAELLLEVRESSLWAEHGAFPCANEPTQGLRDLRQYEEALLPIARELAQEPAPAAELSTLGGA